MKTVLGYLRPYAGRAACGVLIKFSTAVLELILPLLLANVIDVLVPARDLPALWRTGGLMLVLAFGAAEDRRKGSERTDEKTVDLGPSRFQRTVPGEQPAGLSDDRGPDRGRRL